MQPTYIKLADGATQCTVYFEEHPIRATEDKGDLSFCLKDACDACDLTSPHKSAAQIREEFGCPELNSAHLLDALGRDQEYTMITEPQLYFLMMRGRSETAKRFRQWVYNELIPTLRKHGSYQVRTVEPSPAPALATDATLPAVPSADQDGNYQVSYIQVMGEIGDHYGMTQQGRDLLAWCIDRAKAQGYAIAKHQLGGPTQVNWGLSEEQVKKRIEAATLCLRIDLAKAREAVDKLETELTALHQAEASAESRSKEAQADTQELRTKLELACGLVRSLIENPSSKALPELAQPLMALLAPKS